MLLIGLREFALSCSSAFFGLCFRCASVNALFCRAKPPNASFFSIFTRALARGVLLNRRCASYLLAWMKSSPKLQTGVMLDCSCPR